MADRLTGNERTGNAQGLNYPQEMHQYDDIINLPHHVSARHRQMPVADRAAQFMPFRALTGYEDAVHETARLTDEKVELTEDEKALLDVRLQRLAGVIGNQPKVTLTYFQPDKKKAGGAYITVAGQLKKMDDFEGILILTGGERILIANILTLQS